LDSAQRYDVSTLASWKLTCNASGG